MAATKKRAPGAGRPAKVAGFRVLTTRLPEEALDELRVHAALRGVSMGDLSREILLAWCDRQPERSKVRRLVGAEARKRRS